MQRSWELSSFFQFQAQRKMENKLSFFELCKLVKFSYIHKYFSFFLLFSSIQIIFKNKNKYSPFIEGRQKFVENSPKGKKPSIEVGCIERESPSYLCRFHYSDYILTKTHLQRGRERERERER